MANVGKMGNRRPILGPYLPDPSTADENKYFAANIVWSRPSGHRHNDRGSMYLLLTDRGSMYLLLDDRGRM